MSAQVRLAVRLMDRTRRIDEFEMATVAYDPAVVVVEASGAAAAIAARIEGAPSEVAISRAAVALSHAQMQEEGSSVRTRLLADGWLLLVRLDRRTGPAIVHPRTCQPMLLAA